MEEYIVGCNEEEQAIIDEPIRLYCKEIEAGTYCPYKMSVLDCEGWKDYPYNPSDDR